MTEQMLQVPRRKKTTKDESKLSFNISEVLSPTPIKSLDDDLGQEYANYRARHGQGGTRRYGDNSGGAGPGPGISAPVI